MRARMYTRMYIYIVYTRSFYMYKEVHGYSYRRMRDKPYVLPLTFV